LRATMRLQLHAGFTFADVGRFASYFAALGISHLYFSPITVARKGSMHGYDVIDPTRVNPELGGEEGLRQLVDKLRPLGLGIILDIVPNHMAACADNPWWFDVFRDGGDSLFAKFFDIDWEAEDPVIRGKVLLPILGRSFEDSLAAGELRLVDENGEYVVRYFDQRFPISPRDYAEITEASPFAYDSATESGRQRLKELLARQHYVLAWWRVTGDEINWRRFFDVNELVALRMEDEEVFESVHALIFRLYEQGLIDGVRIDHVDGLADPGAYCRVLRDRLQALQSRRPASSPALPPYIVVEKILLAGEMLPPHWRTDGTSGYDFMDEVSLLQHADEAKPVLSAAWEAISGRSANFAMEAEAARRQILALDFTSQLEACARSFHRLAQAQSPKIDLSRASLRRALTELLAHFTIYRTYGPCEDASEHDAPFLADALAKARATALSSDRFTLDLLQSWLSEALEGELERLQAIAVRQFQQLSAPVAAKAIEDTAAYRYGRLITRNDVGFDIGRLGFERDEFHARMLARREHSPQALLSTATHDHKRGEDVRARLAIMSEIPEEWTAVLGSWIERSRSLRPSLVGELVPSEGELAILFQTLVGSWPLDLSANERHRLEAYAERIAAWQLKALREAKLTTDWLLPNEPYENAARAFVMRLIAERADPELLGDVNSFASRIAPAGAVNGLAQTVLKLSVPGVPDLYQGTEYWDLSLVDPDNRRPVDFDARIASLDDASPQTLAETWRTGEIKQAIIARLLAIRRESSELFAEGDYRPLRIRGPQARHVIAFRRSLEQKSLYVVVPRLVYRLLGKTDEIAFSSDSWRETWLEFEQPVGSDLRDIFADRMISNTAGRIPIAQLLEKFPVAVLIADG
jgi:(1->4)-alpha-D-glucan 1-alpha-D-glucosylmutase